MSIMPFLQKQHPDIPDSYGLKIIYHDKSTEEFELAEHSLNRECGFLEFATKEDLWNWIPLTSIKRLVFDKRFSKIIAIKKEIDGQKSAQPPVLAVPPEPAKKRSKK